MLPKTLKGFAVVVDGFGYFGRLNSGQLPKLVIKMEEFRDGGMDAPVELDMGSEKMEAEYGFAEYDPNLLSLWGLIGQTKTLILTGSMEGEDGSTTPIVGTLTGVVKQSDFGDWKSGGEKTELKLMHAVRYFQLMIGARQVYEIDVENCIRRIDGVDQLAARRLALGI